MELSSKQAIQEDQYEIPYHWFKRRDTFDGRVYFGYLDMCRTYIDNPKEAVILDAGCGDGRFFAELEAHGVQRKNMHGTDYSQKSLDFTHVFFPEIPLALADLTEEKSLPYEDNTFDHVFLIETLEHIKPELIHILIENVRRVLKKGGTFVITVPSEFESAEINAKHYQHFTPEKLRSYLGEVFTEVSITGQDYGPGHILKTVYKLLHNRYWDIIALSRYFNRKVWPKRFNQCSPKVGKRLVSVWKK